MVSPSVIETTSASVVGPWGPKPNDAKGDDVVVASVVPSEVGAVSLGATTVPPHPTRTPRSPTTSKRLKMGDSSRGEAISRADVHHRLFRTRRYPDAPSHPASGWRNQLVSAWNKAPTRPVLCIPLRRRSIAGLDVANHLDRCPKDVLDH